MDLEKITVLREGNPLPKIPFISVILPVRNEEQFISDTLSQLREQNYPVECCEFLVCDGESDDSTIRIVNEISNSDPRVILLNNPGRRSSSGRNVGFLAAKGDIVVVVDGHVKIDSMEYLASLAAVSSQSSADCLGRPQPLIPTGNSLVSEAIVLARASWLGHSPSSYIYSDYEGPAKAASMGAAYRPYIFKAIGLVDESFDACEDLEFNTRLDINNFSCFTSPKLKVSYYARDSFAGLFKQMHRYGFGRFKYLRKHPNEFSIAQVIPFFFILGIILVPILAVLWPLGFLLGISFFGLYSVAVFGSALQVSYNRGLSLFFLVCTVLVTIMGGLGIGFWSAVIRRGKIKT